jgi:hypothetical protein
MFLDFNNTESLKTNLFTLFESIVKNENDLTIDDILSIKNVLKLIRMTNLSIYPQEKYFKFYYGTTRSIKNESVLRLKLQTGRVLFYDKIEDFEILNEIKNRFGDITKPGIYLSKLNPKFSQFEYVQAPNELKFNIHSLKDFTDDLEVS